MKKILTSIIFLLIAITCQPQQIPVTVSWNEKPIAIDYIIYLWTSPTANSPLVEDATIGFIDSLGLSLFIVADSIGIFEVVFMSPVNGEYIQAAGFAIDQFGQSLGASLTVLKRKPFGWVKMSGMNLDF